VVVLVVVVVVVVVRCTLFPLVLVEILMIL